MKPDALAAILAREQQAYAAARPNSLALSRRTGAHFPYGVPMHWMRDWGTAFPLFVHEAQGAELVDADGHRYVDFCLGDTGAMFGHSPPVIAQAIAAQAAHGLTCMLPAETAATVGEALADVFGLPWWQLTQTATDANRAVLRHARAITGRPRILVFNHGYHGTVDETMVVMGEGGRTLPRPGQVGRIHDVAASTVVVEFNDLPALESALACGDIACVLAEPVMTNAGMVLPQPGFLEALRAACTRQGTLLVIDETHTLSSGRGGYARTHGLAPDFLVCGKAVAGGLPCAVYGFTDGVAGRLREADAAREPGHSGLGTTLAANPLVLAALAASLTRLMTRENHAAMDRLAVQLAEGLAVAFAARGIGWQLSRVGARLEFGRGPPPRNGSESLAAIDHDLEAAMHLFLLNRGFLLTPFHNMMLVSPATTRAQVERFLVAFDSCLDVFQPLMRAA
jgi:glutamate-1-semialdehyde 2,1-aminomutase